MVEREDFELMRQAKKSKLHHLYWVLYTCATVYAFIITMCYWLLVHDPGEWGEKIFGNIFLCVQVVSTVSVFYLSFFCFFNLIYRFFFLFFCEKDLSNFLKMYV